LLTRKIFVRWGSKGRGMVHMYVCIFICVGQNSKKMSAMRIRHKKLSCVLTVRERNLLKETKEFRERKLALLKELKETKNKLYA
jgi:hypothetical protein